MSLRVDTVSLISGAIVCGNRGLGVLGSLIPASGDHGPGYTYNDLSLPADNGKEICGRITTWPTGGALTTYEDTSFEYSGTTDTFQYQLYVDGVAVGLPTTVTLQVGAATAQISVTSDSSVFSGASSSLSNSSALIVSTSDDSIFSGASHVSPVSIIVATSGNSAFSGGASSLGVLTLTPADIDAIADAVWSHIRGKFASRFGYNKFITDPATGIATLYDDDGISVLKQWNIFEDVSGLQPYRGRGAERRDPI